MQNTITIENSVYEEMRKLPHFFLRLYEKTEYDQNGNEHDLSQWEFIDYHISFPAGNFGNRNYVHCLCSIEGATFCQDSPNNVIMTFHDITSSVEDYYCVIYYCIYRYTNNNDDQYCFVELLWILDKIEISEKNLYNAIAKLPKEWSQTLFKIIRQICKCLSYNKQQSIKRIANKFAENYDIYVPKKLIEAIQLEGINIDIYNNHIFNMVDVLMSSSKNIDSQNTYLKLKNWLHTQDSIKDYSLLGQLFSIFSKKMQLQIVKRYFHDVRLQNTTFDLGLLKQFKDNGNANFIKYRYALTMPGEKICLTIPLLCDSIITLVNSKGTEFQKFEGVLDLAICHCDIMHPSIDFQMKEFLPTCKNSAVYYRDFKGFIDYQTVNRFDRNKITFETIRNYFLLIGWTQKPYGICQYGNGNIMSDFQFKWCGLSFPIKKISGYYNKIKTPFQHECINIKHYDDIMLVPNNANNINIVRTCIPFIQVKQSIINDKYFEVDLKSISINCFYNYLRTTVSNLDTLENGEFVVPSGYESLTIKLFSEKLRMRIIPRDNAKIDKRFDVFGYWKEITAGWTLEDFRNEKSIKFKDAEKTYIEKVCNEIKRRTIASLQKEFGDKSYNGTSFEITYDKELLYKTLNKFYYQKQQKGATLSENFLTLAFENKYKPYCAPKLNEKKNPAIDLPFFWCRGKECFHNNLGTQTLSNQNNWKEYSLYHLVEIIGYPKIQETEAGNVPDVSVTNFIAIANKAMQKFKRLKCRSCGHLIFPTVSHGFNNYNYYACRNQNCPEHNKAIYLNYCYKCKKGLIDSRDTKKCPNDWYICPTCLSCCDDNLYQLMAQRYTAASKPIPDKIKNMLGQGHNDKGLFYCPFCGTQLEKREDEHGYEEMFCSKCQKRVLPE